jgi:hypothetical protein
MIRARSLPAALSLFAVAAAASGCVDNATVRYRPSYAAAPAQASAPIAAGPRYAQSPCAPPPCAPPPCAPPPCEPAPCAPPPPPPCGLPCERGVSEWHVRGVIGVPYLFGTDAGHGCDYWGVDVGNTRCNCVGIDAFYRTMTCSDKRVGAIGPLPSPTSQVNPRVAEARFDRNGFGEDGGTIQFVGVKATYQGSIANSKIYGYVGAGPEYFWTQKYIDNDSGIGGFAEAGLGWRFASWGSLRLGVDVHGDYTSVTRKAIVDSGESRLLWTVAPIVGVEFDF